MSRNYLTELCLFYHNDRLARLDEIWKSVLELPVTRFPLEVFEISDKNSFNLNLATVCLLVNCNLILNHFNIAIFLHQN